MDFFEFWNSWTILLWANLTKFYFYKFEIKYKFYSFNNINTYKLEEDTKNKEFENSTTEQICKIPFVEIKHTSSLELTKLIKSKIYLL